MARPRRGKRRRQGRDWLIDYLVTGIIPPDDPEVNVFDVWDACRRDSPDLRAAWDESRIMRDWNTPGSRPFAWWLFDAPRLPEGTFPGTFWDGKLPEHRLHLGGSGCPLHELFNVVPLQHFGIWNWFGDPRDPPIFEPQFDYLVRLDLLLPDESEPVPETQTRPESMMDSVAWETLREKIANDRQT